MNVHSAMRPKKGSSATDRLPHALFGFVERLLVELDESLAGRVDQAHEAAPHQRAQRLRFDRLEFALAARVLGEGVDRDEQLTLDDERGFVEVAAVMMQLEEVERARMLGREAGGALPDLAELQAHGMV